MADKINLFPNSKNDKVNNRLLHSVEIKKASEEFDPKHLLKEAKEKSKARKVVRMRKKADSSETSTSLVQAIVARYEFLCEINNFTAIRSNKTWEKCLEMVGSIEGALKYIDWVFENWQELISQDGIFCWLDHDVPTPSLFTISKAYMDVVAHNWRPVRKRKDKQKSGTDSSFSSFSRFGKFSEEQELMIKREIFKREISTDSLTKEQLFDICVYLGFENDFSR